MAQFQYTAVNQSGKKLNGIVSAENEEEARKQLGSLGIAILSIQKNSETPVESATNEPGTTSEFSKFEFEAFDKMGKKVVGSIAASSRYKAFQRLVDEYAFEVSYVIKAGASEEEKEKAKHEDLSILKAEYINEAKAKGQSPQEAGNTNLEFEAKRQTLLKKVDFILNKIKEILANYNENIKPENKKIIQDYIDKLLRIKSSTNLDYIEHTSEELLKKVQDQELFLHKEKTEKERGIVKLETQKLMAELHTGEGSKKDIVDDFETVKNKMASSKNKFLIGISNLIAKHLPTEEEKDLKNQIKAVNRQILIFIKIWITSAKITKEEAKRSLRAVWEEKKRLKEELKALQQKKKAASKTAITSTESAENTYSVNEPLIIEELNHFLGWLLSFYLAAYFISYYFASKMMPMQKEVLGSINLLGSATLRYLLISIFLWYVLFSIKIEFFKYKGGANTFVLFLGIILNATLIFNL